MTPAHIWHGYGDELRYWLQLAPVSVSRVSDALLASDGTVPHVPSKVVAYGFWASEDEDSTEAEKQWPQTVEKGDSEMSGKGKLGVQGDDFTHLPPERIQEMVNESGIPLSDQELEQISGGWNDSSACANGQHDYRYRGMMGSSRMFVCEKCGDGYLE